LGVRPTNPVMAHRADARIPGFEYDRIEVGDASYNVAVGGDGPPVVLLHGYPQTQFCWREVAPELARDHRVIAPDIRGYGATTAPPGGPHGEGYSKREMAADVVSLLDALDVDRAAVIGHDRGGRVGYRMALDHPERVERVAVLNVVPTIDQFERVTPDNAIGYWPWFFLAQPAPFPERLIAAAPDHYLRSIFGAWAARPERIADAVDQYVDAFDEETIAATCADYRASFHIDRRLDAADRSAGRTIKPPLLVLWGGLDEDFSDDSGPLGVWRRWAERVDGRSVPAGHFIPEEAPDEVVAALSTFLGDQPP
jgi:haloacetate dehalogenase